MRPAENADITKKVEYNRWLVRQDNTKSANEVREAQKEGTDVIKERQRLHATQGLSRQQAAMVQMKRASEALEAHRQGNLSKGRQVYEEVSGWRVQERKEKDEYAAKGKANVKAVKDDDLTKAAVEAAAAERKARAALTRKEDEEKAKELEELKAMIASQAKEKTARVKAETADSITDEAKRLFYEQRLKKANEIKQAGEQWNKKREEERSKFQEGQVVKKTKAKTARQGAGKSREDLKTQRAAAAAKMREAKRELSDAHKQNLQIMYADRASKVKDIISAGYVQSDMSGEGAPASPTATGGKAPASPTSAGRSERATPGSAAART